MKIRGTKFADYLIGTDEADTIKGGRGRDVIDGGDGDNTLIGGKGADTFLLRADADGVSVIRDFQPGKDRIILEAPDQWWASYNVDTGSIASGTLATTIPLGEFGPVVAVVDGPPHLFNQYEDLITI